MAGKILEAFPKEFTSRHDYLILEPMFRLADQHAESTGRLQLQHELHLIRQHVTACHHIWLQIRSGRLTPSPSVTKQYQASLAGESKVRSPVKTPSRSGSAASEKNIEAAALRRLQLAELSRIWAEAPRVADVPELTRFGDLEVFKRLKVSCGAALEGYAPSQTFV